MTYASDQNRWFPVTIVTRDVNGQRIIHKSPDMTLVCELVEDIEDKDELEILFVIVDNICIYSQLGNNPITWDDITGFFG